MSYEPQLKEWSLLFYGVDRKDNRRKVARAFANFWEDRKQMSFFPPGECILGGKVFGYPGYEEGEEILTAKVYRIERASTTKCDGKIHRMMRVITRPGGVYYLCPYNTSDETLKLLSDISRFNGKVPESSDRYVPESYRSKNLL